MQPFTRAGYELLHEGAIELARVESNGIRIDTELLRRTKLDLKEKVRASRADLEKDELWKRWRKRFGLKSSLTSRDQLKYILYKELKVQITKTTEKGAAAVDDEVLQNVDHDFARNLSAFYRYEKALGTFLKGIEWELAGGDRLRPFFDLHTARTIRSSSSAPNFQNFPVRNKEIAEMIRSLFAATKGWVLPENDFKGIEVGVSACYHQDENFISYITTPGKDMHRDMAKQIYCFSDKEWDKLPAQVAKDARYGAKNKFVFPQFYGDWYLTCAKNLWEWMDKGGLKRADGTPFKEHLRQKGITKLGACDPKEKPKKGTFERHLKEIEDDFWNRRFRQYGRWRKQFYEDYLRKGYFDILSGFRIRGVYSKNQVTNAPVQGAAFHCLLWTLIQMNVWLREKQMEGKLVGQIHDSMIGDVPVPELRPYLMKAESTVTKDLRRHFTWLNVPLEIEYEIPPLGEPWSQKQEYKFKKGEFNLPKTEIWTPDTELFLKKLKEHKQEKEHKEPRTGHRSGHSVPSKLSQSRI
jgi:DNA polymerase I-like protein with 3'-5' exonuclease and polymerase domains